jgi:hypothetical protein
MLGLIAEWLPACPDIRAIGRASPRLATPVEKRANIDREAGQYRQRA